MNLPIKFKIRFTTLENEFGFEDASDILIVRFGGEFQNVSAIIHIFQETIRQP
jgi:hypothetical protein